MQTDPMTVEGAWVFTPRQLGDDRGVFLEWYRHEALTAAAGHPLDLRQANCSVSAAGTVRGIHFADVPPGQAKFVTCVRGAVMDVVVDLRVGSPTFGRWDAVRLDDADRRTVYVSEGLGHAFAALTDDATVVYLCSETYNPAGEHGVNPLDPVIGIDWTSFGITEPLLSAKDQAAPTLDAARDRGLLPAHAACLAHRQSLADAAARAVRTGA